MDRQRQRVYRAENVAFYGTDRQLDDVDGCREYLESVVSTRFWRSLERKYGRSRTFHSRPWLEGSGRITSARAGRNGRVRMPTQYPELWHRWVVLHELAHVLVGNSPEGGYHGRIFCCAYLELVRRFLGREAYLELRRQFVSYGVRHTRPREYSQETLAQLRRQAAKNFSGGYDP